MELKLDRAGKLVSGLAGERVRWEKTVEVHTHTSMHTHAYARRHAHLMKPGNTTDCVFFLNAGSGDGHGLSSGRLSTGCCVSLIHGSFSVQLQRRAAHKDLDKTGYSSSPYNRNIFRITVRLFPSFCTSLFFPYTHTLSVVQGVGGSMLSRLQLCCFPLQSHSRAWLEHPGSSLRCFLHWEWSYRHPRQPVSPHQTDLPALLWPTDRL